MSKHDNKTSLSDRHHHKSISESESESDPDQKTRKSKSSSKDRKSKSSKRKRSYSSSSSSSSDSEYDSRKRRRKDKKRKEEKRETKRRREKHKDKKNKKKKKLAVTDSWGKYGLVKETDMWNKRPEFTAWLAEVKKVNLESLPTWEEKQLFKDFMEDHNTATFPSKKYYNLDAYYERKMVKDLKKGISKVQERTVFDDEEQRRLELQRERERHKEEQVEALKRSMQGGMAQAMKEQAQLKEEMAYQYKLGNFEAAAAIQRRLDPDIL